MNAKLRRLTFTAKTNKKKRSEFRFFRSDQTFYLAFILSIIVHIGVLYSIPAVELFSDGAHVDDEKLILLDLLEDEALALSDEPALSEEQEHQFQAAISEIPWDWSEELRESEPDPEIEADDVEFTPLPQITELKNDYTLVSETHEQKPDIKEALITKRNPEELPARSFKSRQPDIEKPAADQIPPKPVIQSETSLEEQTPPPEPVQKNSLPAQKKPAEDLLSFPRRSPHLEERRKPRLAEKNLTRPVFENQQVRDRNLQEPQELLLGRRDTSNLQKYQLGLARESELDKNRFGIFAGQKFEDPRFQEAEPAPQINKEDPEGPDDVTQKAESLQAESEIEGPVRGRAIIYRPRPPQIGSIDLELELRLKFWVLPDGTIGEVIPIKRGNAQLEQVAIGYLKKWQFEPLPADAPHKEIWGTIPIKFTAQ